MRSIRRHDAFITHSITVALFGLAMVFWALGCSSTNLAEVVKAMASDPATSCFREEGLAPYVAPISFYRTNIQNGSVKCDSNGLQVSTVPPTTDIPVRVQAVPASH